jgi:hypothetical protein
MLKTFDLMQQGKCGKTYASAIAPYLLTQKSKAIPAILIGTNEFPVCKKP